MTPSTLICPGCGGEFEKTKRAQKYCTPACQVKANNRRNWSENKDQQNALRNQRRAERLPIREFQCEVCGKTVETRETRARRFCSKKCKNDHHNAHMKNAAIYKERAKEYRKANRARLSAKHAEYYQQNRDRIRAVEAEKFQTTRRSTPWRSLMAGAASRCRIKGIVFDLTEDWAIDRWTGRCELTQIAFVVGQPKSAPRMFSPSIDRIDPRGGYTQDNCRFILQGINALKGEESDQNMLLLAKALIDNYPLSP